MEPPSASSTNGCPAAGGPVAAPRHVAAPTTTKELNATSQLHHHHTSASASACSSNITSPSTASSASTSSSEPQYSEDVRRGMPPPRLDLLARQGSGSSTKTCEVDLGDEERDTFSPVSTGGSSASVSPSAPVAAIGAASSASLCNGSEVLVAPLVVTATIDNKIFDGSATKLGKPHGSGAGVSAGSIAGGGLMLTATKEEKQRQNEEIVIMETSSISSETGSWESVFPHAVAGSGAAAAAASDTASGHLPPVVGVAMDSHFTANSAAALLSCCSEFLQNERKVLQGQLEKPRDKVESRPEPAPGSPYLGGRERSYSTSGQAAPSLTAADTSSLFGGTASPLLRDLDRCDNPLTASGTSGCFIDASSLRDEDEVLSFPSLDGHQSHEDLMEDRHDGDDDDDSNYEPHEPDEAQERGTRESRPFNGLTGEEAGEADESPTKKLETFHKAFAKCKVKTAKEVAEDFMASSHKSGHSSSSNSGIESPQKGICESAASASSMNNLSDEEKLWKREHDTQQKTSQPKDHYEKELLHQQEDATEASVSLAADADSSDSSDIVKLRREQERKLNGSTNSSSGLTGAIPIAGGGGGGSGSGSSYIFHHNMQQFSIHPLAASPKFNVSHGPHSGAGHTHVGANGSHPTVVTAAHSDLSYTTDYSSSSPAPSLVWSEHENRPSVRHHADDFDGPLNGGGSTGGGLAGPHKATAASTASSMLPDTPHNSIVHIDNASSNTSSIHRDYTLSSSFSHQRDSGAYCSDATDSPVPMPRTPKRSKFDEANPIVSGGVSIRDFNPKKCESPPVKRKTDICPIVSGGFVSLDFEPTRPVDEDDDEEVELRPKPKTRKPIPGIASWVVDMSDCRPERRKSTSSTSSQEAPLSGRFRERSDSTSSHKSGCGFYVSLDDMDKKPVVEQPSAATKAMSKSYTAPKSVGYTVNLSQSEYKPKDKDKAATEEEAAPATSEDKKNIFSMFIDFGGDKPKSSGPASLRREPFSLAQRLSSSASSTGRRSDETMKSSASSTETLMSKSGNLKALAGDPDNSPRPGSGESKSLDYRCNTEPPITVAAIRRISQQQRGQTDASKRHSWSTNNSGGVQTKDSPTASGGHDYKRSISLTATKEDGCKDVGGGSGLMSIIDKLPIISKASSLSIDSSLSPYDEYVGGSKSELSTCSNNSARNSMSGGEREEGAVAGAAGGGAHGRLKKRRRDVQINETFDKSSLASITDGILSKDMSPASTTDTDDLTFQQDEELAIREAALQPLQALATSSSNRSSAIIMETIIETKETSSPKKTATGHTMETLHATIEKQKQLLETVNEHVEAGGGGGGAEKCSFVKLSDMDKPVKFELQSPDTMSKSAGNHRQINRLFRDETKMRPHSWTMTRSTGNSFLNITNSVDNLRSLSRLFPHFSKEFSNSVPNDMVLDNMDYIQTDLSADSSLASSFSRSGMDESSMSCRQPRRLGEDLLKMFLQEIATDMVVEVHGRRIKAHKCILRSRCQYFAAMLAGSGSQSAVALQGYSYPAVHFALCHIYSGASHPPDGISLMELAALADLLGLEGLKEVTAHALRTNYCHNFHKPCSGCIDGILQVLPVALNHALDDLYRKCLRWTCRHYLKVWPTRQFAQLPPDIHGRCRQQIVAYLTSESVLDTVLDCDDMLGQLAAYRWGGICENLVRDILDAAYAYVADHFASLIASDSFLLLGHDRSCHIPRLEGLLLRTASSLTPDQACRSYQRVTRLNTVLQAKIIQMPANLGELAKELQNLQEEDLDWDPEYIRLVSALLSAVEQCLIRQCSRAMRVTAWQRMDLELRKKIQTLARLTEPLDMKRSKPVSKAFTFSGSTRNQDLYQVKLAIQAHSKRALAQDTQLYKATQTQDTATAVQTVERGVQANNDLREGSSKLMKSNSRAYVPSGHHRASSQSGAASERTSLSSNHHRRTQSEVPVPVAAAPKSTAAAPSHPMRTSEGGQPAPKQKTPRLSDVRPRYLEPRKTHNGSGAAPALPNGTSGPVRSATSSSIPAQRGGAKAPHHHHLSSSDSSRNSSPAAARKLASSGPAPVKIGTKSTNMSLDSLASPSRRPAKGARGKSSDAERFSDASLTGSMKSSMITNKTVSHESLTSTATAKLSRSNPLIGNNRYAISQGGGVGGVSTSASSGRQGSTGFGGHPVKRGASVGSRPPKHLQQAGGQHIKSTGSSPSSVNTTKSATSRLSSVSSTHSSRDLFKHRSISVPAADPSAAAAGQRHSFLSAKSREILAKRAEKNKMQQQQQQGGGATNMNGCDDKANNGNVGPQRSASHSSVTAAMNAHNRNSLPSNIPMRRPNSLMLKTKNTVAGGRPLNVSNGNQVVMVATTKSLALSQKVAQNGGGGGVVRAANAVRHKLELLIDNTNIIDTNNTHTTTNTTMGGGESAGSPPPGARVESKLERSSTFCKESSDIDMNELQIIE